MIEDNYRLNFSSSFYFTTPLHCLLILLSTTHYNTTPTTPLAGGNLPFLQVLVLKEMFY